MDDVLKHFGTKGMKWGVRNDKRSTKITIGDRLGSLKRERQWKKVLKEVDSLTTSQITSVGKRVGLENDLKRLSKNSKIATAKDKRDYIDRAGMSDSDLSRKVTRLRAKDTLEKNISSASKEQRELGEKIVNAGGALTLKYAATKSITPQDIFDAVNNPKPIKDKSVKQLVEQVTKRQ